MKKHYANNRCNVCGKPLETPVYRSEQERSVTSLSEIHQGRTEVYFCSNCGHLQTPEIRNIDEYYDDAYKILVGSDEEDQLYKVTGDRKIYRSDHQASVLLSVIELPPNAQVLDYGCAKAATPRKLLKLRPDISLHLFDVSDMYIPFWEKFVSRNNWALYSTDHWEGEKFDLVTSFYSLEHMPDPLKSIREMGRMLRHNGIIYVVVPNWRANIADFIVVDHVNHFSESSVRELLRRAGLELSWISADVHDSALVFTARKVDHPSTDSSIDIEVSPPQDLLEQVESTAMYWRNFQSRIQDTERLCGDQARSIAIYGSGFYGTYIATCLSRFGDVECFVDQNPYRQGIVHFGKPVVSPEGIPSSVRNIFVGLNPAKAKSEIGQGLMSRYPDINWHMP